MSKGSKGQGRLDEPLDSSTTGETANSGLGDALDVLEVGQRQVSELLREKEVVLLTSRKILRWRFAPPLPSPLPPFPRPDMFDRGVGWWWGEVAREVV
jgi:hypothetical protein